MCIPTYSHSFLVLSKKGCGYTTSPNSLKPSLMAGHFIWEEYEWMLQTAQNRVRQVVGNGTLPQCPRMPSWLTHSTLQ